MSAKVIAVSIFLVSFGIGILTNLITSNFSWALAAALGSLLVLGIFFVWLGSSASPPALRPLIKQRARRGGVITSSPIDAHDGARVSDHATTDGQILRSPISAKRSLVKRSVSRRGRIEDSEITTD